MDTVSVWRSPAAALDVFREQHHFLEGVNMPEEHPRLVKVSEAAKHLRVDRGTLARRARDYKEQPSTAERRLNGRSLRDGVPRESHGAWNQQIAAIRLR
jgi:hypothetical protein